MLDKLNQFDTHLFLYLNSLHSPFWDTIMWHISGKLEWVPLYVILIYFVIRKYKWQSIPVLISIVVLITLTDSISSHLIKNNVQRLRPSNNPELEQFIHLVNNYHGGKFGFLSSHAANTFAIATFLSFLFKKRWFTLCIVFWAFVVSYSRIYLGVHYPGDVTCGALLGVLISVLIFRLYLLFNKYYRLNKKTYAEQ